MENEKDKPQNGAAQSSQGSSVPKGKPQGERNEVKEGDASQQRPAFGADGGPNTSSREDQLPSLGDGSDAEKEDEDGDEIEKQQKGSDADTDKGGEASI